MVRGGEQLDKSHAFKGYSVGEGKALTPLGYRLDQSQTSAAFASKRIQNGFQLPV